MFTRSVLRATVMAVFLWLFCSFSVAAPWSVEVEVKNTEEVDRVDELVSSGLPFPEGVLSDPAHIRVRDSEGGLIVCQAHQLGISWPDGSIRWALVQFPASVAAGGGELFTVSVEPDAEIRMDIAVSVREENGRIEVDSGRMRLMFDRRGAAEGKLSGFPERVEVADGAGNWETVMDEPPSVHFVADREHMTLEEFKKTGLHPNTLWSFGLGGQWQHAEDAKRRGFDGKFYCVYVEGEDPPYWTAWHDWTDRIERDIDYSEYFGGPVELEIEESGPVRAVVAFSSPGKGKEGEIGYNGRIYVTAGAKQFRVELTVENYEDSPQLPVKTPRYMVINNTKHIREFRLGFKPDFAVEHVGFGLDGEKAAVAIGEDGGYPRLLQRAVDEAVLVDGRNGAERSEAGARGDGWMEASGEKNSLVLAQQYFWEIYPKALGYDTASGRIYMELWPSEAPAPGYHFTPGRIRTYEFEVGIDTEPEKVSAAARMPLRHYCGAEYFSRSGTAYPALPLGDESFPSYAGYLKRGIERWEERQLMYGDINFGDQAGAWSRYSAAHGYHGVSDELLMFYLSSGNPEIFRLAEAAVKHHIEIDRSHWGTRSGEHNQAHASDQNHKAARIMGGIGVWNVGDVTYYFLTGRRRVLPTLEKTTSFLLNTGGVRAGSFIPGRATSLPFKHLAYMYKAIGDEQAVAELYPERYTPREFPHRKDSVGFDAGLEIFQRIKDLAVYFTELMLESPESGRGTFTAGYAPEGLYHFWRLTGDDEAGEAVELGAYIYNSENFIMPSGIPKYRGWRVWYDETDLFPARAYQVSGNKRYLEYPTASLDWRLRIVGIPDRRKGFGSTIPSTLWILREAGMTEDDLESPRGDIDYDSALEEMISSVEDKFDDYAFLSGGERRGLNMINAEIGRVLISIERYEDALAWLESWIDRTHISERRDADINEDVIERLIKRIKLKKAGAE